MALGDRLKALFKLPNLLRKIVISTLVGVLTFLIAGQELPKPQTMWSVSVTLFVGGVAFLVQYLLDVDRRLGQVESAQQESADATSELIDARFDRIDKATPLFGLVEATALRREDINQVIRYSASINAESASLVSAFANAELARFAAFLRALGGGERLDYDGEDRDWLLALTRSAQHTIDAMTLVTVEDGQVYLDGGSWTSDLGQRYLTEQIAAIGRRVRVRRIFVIDGEAVTYEQAFADVWRTQQNLDVDVKVFDRRANARIVVPAAVVDFVLFDGTISYATTPATRTAGSGRPILVKTDLELRETQVRERLSRFETIWAAADDPQWPVQEGDAGESAQ